MSPIPGIWVMSGAIVWDGASLGDAEVDAPLGDGDPVPSFGLTASVPKKAERHLRGV